MKIRKKIFNPNDEENKEGETPGGFGGVGVDREPMISILEEERKDQLKQANFEEAEGQAVAGEYLDQVGQDASYREEYD